MGASRPGHLDVSPFPEMWFPRTTGRAVHRSRGIRKLDLAISEARRPCIFLTFSAGAPRVLDGAILAFAREDRTIQAACIPSSPWLHLRGPLNVDLVTQRTKTNSWGISLRAGSNPLGWEDGESDVQIVAGALPPPGRNQCAVVSVGREGGRFTFGSQISILQMFEEAGYLTREWEGEPTLPVNSLVYRLGQYHVFFVEARDEQGGQDLRMISKATGAVLDAAAALGFEVVFAPLLAAGPTRITAASFLLTEMLRGFARWRKQNQTTNISLMIYVVDPEVLNCLRSGRLDPAEILSCDDLRFWLEIEDREGAVERIPYHMPAETKIKTLMRTACNLSCDKWTFGIRPAPHKDKPFLQSSEIRDTDR